MASSNVVAEVRLHLTKAIKAKSSTVQTPAKWAAEAGFQGSAASALRAHMARSSGNGCGRTSRYPEMTAEALLDLLDLADAYKAAEGAKADTLAKRIGTKVRPAARQGAKAAKTQAKRTPRTSKVSS